MGERPEFTRLLHDVQAGKQGALDELFPIVYDELRRIAHNRLVKYRPGQTLNTTALVHEAYLKLVDQTQAAWSDRAHFFALASRAMRFILVDYARERSAQKRGGDLQRVEIEHVALNQAYRLAEERAVDLLTIDTALQQLTETSDRLGQLVEYRFFGGLTYEEIAEVTGWSVATVKRDWRRARAWLYQTMQSLPGT